MTTRSEQVGYLVELMAFDARRELGGDTDRNRYYDFAFSDDGESEYFNELAQTLSDSGRKFAKDLADVLIEISLNYETGERFSKALQDFLSHLDDIFEERIESQASEQVIPDARENWSRLRRLVDAEAVLSRKLFRSTGSLPGAHTTGQLAEQAPSSQRPSQPADATKPALQVSDDPAGSQKVDLAKRRGRTIGSGFQKADSLILDQMKVAIDREPALNATSAARLFTDQAAGTSIEAKVDRLARRYREKYREREKSGIIKPPS